jgi:DNA-binding transcriptional regulator YdaS (Cro superfamily)
MPVATAAKVEALKVDFGSQRRLADMLGVSPAQVSRWLRGQGIDPLNADKIDVLELAMASLLRLYDPEVARQWLLGVNPHLGNRRPIDLVRTGRGEALLGAIRAERAGSYA